MKKMKKNKSYVAFKKSVMSFWSSLRHVGDNKAIIDSFLAFYSGAIRIEIRLQNSISYVNHLLNLVGRKLVHLFD